MLTAGRTLCDIPIHPRRFAWLLYRPSLYSPSFFFVVTAYILFTVSSADLFEAVMALQIQLRLQSVDIVSSQDGLV